MRAFGKLEGLYGVGNLTDVSIGVLKSKELALQSGAAINSGTRLEKGTRMRSLYSVWQVSGRPATFSRRLGRDQYMQLKTEH